MDAYTTSRVQETLTEAKKFLLEARLAVMAYRRLAEEQIKEIEYQRSRRTFRTLTAEEQAAVSDLAARLP